MDMAEV